MEPKTVTGTPLGQVTLDWLSRQKLECIEVILAYYELVMELRAKMPEAADHLLRCIYVTDDGSKYDPGDEPAITFDDHTGLATPAPVK